MTQRTALDMAPLTMGHLGIRTVLKMFGGIYTVAGKTIARMTKAKEHGVFSKGSWDEEDLQREGCEATAVRFGVKRILEDVVRE